VPIIDTVDVTIQVLNPMPPWPDSLFRKIYVQVENMTDPGQALLLLEPQISAPISLTGPGYVNNIAGALQYQYYNQLTPTKGELYVEIWVYFTAPLAERPINFSLTINNGQGAIVVNQGQF
jgi:hypothetical protein